MPEVHKRPLAFADLAEIWSFIADDSERQADLFLAKLAEKFDLLATQPMMGRERSELMPALRSFPIDRYIVFFVPLPNGIDIIRVVHSARDITDADFTTGGNA